MMSKSACSTVNKDAVATAFSKAVNSYDKFAGFQRDVGTHLLHLLEAELPWNKTGYKNSAETTVNVLDLGCGTGYLSAQLSQNNAALGLNAIAATVNIIAVDIALAMAQRAQSHASHIHALVADADQLAFLKKRECEVIQGYYFSRPLSASDMTKKFEQIGTEALFK